ncbi:hypothetical protein D3C85_15350 [compost metagenome]
MSSESMQLIDKRLIVMTSGGEYMPTQERVKTNICRQVAVTVMPDAVPPEKLVIHLTDCVDNSELIKNMTDALIAHYRTGEVEVVEIDSMPSNFILSVKHLDGIEKCNKLPRSARIPHMERGSLFKKGPSGY